MGVTRTDDCQDVVFSTTTYYNTILDKYLIKFGPDQQ